MQRWWLPLGTVWGRLAGWAMRPGKFFDRHIGHHLPVTFFLAVLAASLSMYTPNFMRSAVAASVAVTVWVDEVTSRAFALVGWPESAFQEAVRKAEVESRNHGAQARLPSATVLSLPPDAHARFLDRATPTPRLPLACVLLVLHERLTARNPGDAANAAQPRPVLAIDVDTSTVQRPDGKPTSERDASALANKPDDGLNECRDRLRPLARAELGPGDGPHPSIDDAMRAVLRKLAQRAEVVALNFPRRLPADRVTRDQFIAQVCCRAKQAGTDRSCVAFASPQLMFVPGQTVFEFPDTLRLDIAETEAEKLKLPQQFPGIGRVMAEARHRAARARTSASGPQVPAADDKSASVQLCMAANMPVDMEPADASSAPGKPVRWSLDDRLADTALAGAVLRAYDYSPISFGDAMTRISIFEIKADVTRPDKNTYAELYDALQNFDWTELVVLNINPGSTEDQFLIPVTNSAVVPGAWVHAAVALTLIAQQQRDQAQPGAAATTVAQPGVWHKAGKLAEKVALDVGLGLVFAFLVGWLVSGIDPRGNPVGHQVALAVAALVASLFVQVVYLRLFSVRTLFSGEPFYPPLPVLVGLSIHIFLEALGKRDLPAAAVPSGHGDAATAAAPAPLPHADPGLTPRGEWVRLQMQRLWAWALACAVAWALLKPGTLWQWPVALALFLLLLAGAAYRAAAYRVHVLPLPWRHP